jgi:hypothetical protein
MLNIIHDNYENDFKFIVGEDTYFCPSFVAEFLSRRISNSRSAEIVREAVQTPQGPDQIRSIQTRFL